MNFGDIKPTMHEYFAVLSKCSEILTNVTLEIYIILPWE